MVAERQVVKILLVEDSKDDIVITKRALREAKVVNDLYVVRDGQEALDFLKRHGTYQEPATSPKPDLILLDINLPKVNGLDVLTRIKQDHLLRRIPVIMLTSSKRDEDVLRSYDSYCNSFLQKPVQFGAFVQLVRELGLYWVVMNVSPPQE